MSKKKKKKYGNPLKQAAYEQSKKESKDRVVEFASSFVDKIAKNEAFQLIMPKGTSRSSIDENAFIFRGKVALGFLMKDCKEFTSIALNGDIAEMTAAKENDDGTYDLISVICNESNAMVLIPDVKQDDVKNAASFARTYMADFTVKKFGKYYPEFLEDIA